MMRTVGNDMKGIYIAILIAIIASGCSYSVRMNQYPHLRTLTINPVINNTYELLLDEILRDNLIAEFQKDGRLRIVYDNPDAVIDMEIKEYDNSIFGYDNQQNVEEYMVKMLLIIRFTDLVTNSVIWENNAFIISERYTPNSSESVRFSSEEEARSELFSNMFKTIVRNTLESW